MLLLQGSVVVYPSLKSREWLTLHRTPTVQKKKKDKKKKDKKKKKDSDGEADEVAGEVEHLHIEDKLDEIAHKPDAKKSKFELQMEAALKKNEAEEHEEADEMEAKKATKMAEKARKEAEIAKQIAEQEEAKAKSGAEEGKEEDGEVFYGAPDEKVWSDKSQAHMDAEAEAAKGPDLSVSGVLVSGLQFVYCRVHCILTLAITFKS